MFATILKMFAQSRKDNFMYVYFAIIKSDGGVLKYIFLLYTKAKSLDKHLQNNKNKNWKVATTSLSVEMKLYFPFVVRLGYRLHFVGYIVWGEIRIERYFYGFHKTICFLLCPIYIYIYNYICIVSPFWRFNRYLYNEQ